MSWPCITFSLHFIFIIAVKVWNYETKFFHRKIFLNFLLAEGEIEPVFPNPNMFSLFTDLVLYVFPSVFSFSLSSSPILKFLTHTAEIIACDANLFFIPENFRKILYNNIKSISWLKPFCKPEWQSESLILCFNYLYLNR